MSLSSPKPAKVRLKLTLSAPTSVIATTSGLADLIRVTTLLEFVGSAERHIFLTGNAAAVFRDIFFCFLVGLARPHIVVADQIVAFGFVFLAMPADRWAAC